MKVFRNFLILVTAIFLINPANAQMSANPPEVGAKIREMGAKLGRDVVVTTNKLYGPLLRKMPRKAVNVAKNEVYGPHERHRIDVYQPKKSKSLTRSSILR